MGATHPRRRWHKVDENGCSPLTAGSYDQAARLDHRDELVAERTLIQSRLRWHLHELFPGLAIPPRALCRLHVLEGLDDRMAMVDSTIGLIARELVAHCSELTLRIGQLEREITQIVSQLAPTLLALPGCWRVVDGEDLWRNRWRRSLPIQGGLCSLERDGADPGLVWA